MLSCSRASIQKSVVALLLARALQEDFVRLEDPVSEHLGTGWSKAEPDEYQQARVGNDTVPQIFE